MITHMNQAEVAGRFGMSPRTLERGLTGSSNSPFWKLAREWPYRVVEVEEFERRQLRMPTSQLAPYAGHRFLEGA